MKYVIPNPLKPYGKKIYSQTDEDGIIEDIFSIIPPQSHSFVEFGVGPNHFDLAYGEGLEGNCVLLGKRKWRGLFMDGFNHPARFDVKREFVTATNINSLFRKYNVRDNVDVISIDIDGQDLWVWFALQYRPSLYINEYNPSFTDYKSSKSVPYNIDFRWDGAKHYGASIGALVKVGQDRGYTLVYTNGVSAFFVRDSLLANSEAFRHQDIYVSLDMHLEDQHNRPRVDI